MLSKEISHKARLQNTSDPHYSESMCEDYKTVVYIIKSWNSMDNIKYTGSFILFCPHSPQQWIKLMKLYGFSQKGKNRWNKICAGEFRFVQCLEYVFLAQDNRKCTVISTFKHKHIQLAQNSTNGQMHPALVSRGITIANVLICKSFKRPQSIPPHNQRY